MSVLVKGNTYYDWESLEAEIQRLLDSSNWTQLPDSELAAGNVAAVAAWRQQLRHILWTTHPAHEVTIPDYPLYQAQSTGNTYGVEVPTYGGRLTLKES